MKFVKAIFNFYLNASIHVALAVYALSWITLKEFNLDYDETVLYFVFYATITGYNFIKYFGLAKFHHRRLADWLKVIQIFSALCFVLMCYYAYYLEAKTLLYLVAFGVVTFLYAIPFVPKSIFLDAQQNLRSISGLKIYIIALVWAGVTVLVPLINGDYVLYNFDVFVLFIQRFMLVMVLMLPFEIRDLQYDSVKLATIPQLIGVKRTKITGVLLLMGFFFLEYLRDDLNMTHMLIIFVITIITMLSVVFSNKKRNQYRYCN